MSLDIGDLVPLTVTVRDATGNPVNATTVTLTITLPDGTTVTPTVANPPSSTGVYLYDYPAVQAGHHSLRWTSTGPSAAYSDAFDVSVALPQYLVSLADMKNQLRITGTSDDEQLRRFIEAATTAVERIRGEAAVKRTVTEEHRFPDWFRGLGQVTPNMSTATYQRRAMALNVSPVVSLTSVARVDGTMTWDVSLLHVEQVSGVVDVLFGPAFAGLITVTYVAGYQVIPAEFGLAASFIVEHLWQTRRGAKGGPRPGGMETSMVPGIGYAIPNQAIEVLGGPGLPGFA